MKTLLRLFIILLVSSYANAQTVQWNQNCAGATYFDSENHRLATDSQGNIYTLGNYDGNTKDFDPGSGVFNMNTYLNTQSAFLYKLDPAGNFLWAKQMGNTTGFSLSFGDALTIDAADNIYFAGRLNPVIGTSYDFDMGAGVATLSVTGSTDFIEKLDSNGNYVWAKTFIQTAQNPLGTSDEIHCLKVDAQGNIYATGRFTGTIDFDPNAGTISLSAVNQDVFIIKLAASGSLSWAKSLPSTVTPVPNLYNAELNSGYGIDVDSNGNVYTIGYFGKTLDADPSSSVQTLTAFTNTNPDQVGSFNLFISKLDSNGNHVWAKSLPGDHSLNVLPSIAVDASNNVIIGSYLTAPSVLDLDFGPGTFYLPGNAQSFILKISANADFIWAKSTATRSSNSPKSYTNKVVIDSQNNIYSSGTFSLGACDFDPGAGTFLMTPSSQEIYISKLNTNGDFVWAKQIGGNSSYLASKSIAVTAQGKVIIQGVVYSGGFSRSASLVNTGAFLGSITQPALATSQFDLDQNIAIYPNPSSGNYNITIDENLIGAKVEVYNFLGQKIKSFSLNTSTTNENLYSGMYLLEIEKESVTTTKKLLVN